MNMREAIEKTLALHQMVVDGKYKDYVTARREENSGCCYLCEAGDGSCDPCPWVIIEGGVCEQKPNGENYNDTTQSIIRHNRWLADPRMEAS